MVKINILPTNDEAFSTMPKDLYKELLRQYRLIEEEYETRRRTGTLTESGSIRLKRKLLKIQKTVSLYK